MTTDLLSGIISISVMVGAFVLLPFGKTGLEPWEKIGSRPWVQVVNDTDLGPLYVTVEAPEVDGAVRALGFVAPQSEEFFPLPYADTQVTLRVEDLLTVKLKVDRPKVYQVTVSK